MISTQNLDKQIAGASALAGVLYAISKKKTIKQSVVYVLMFGVIGFAAGIGIKKITNQI
jgi:hypothetical protein